MCGNIQSIFGSLTAPGLQATFPSLSCGGYPSHPQFAGVDPIVKAAMANIKPMRDHDIDLRNERGRRRWEKLYHEDPLRDAFDYFAP